MERSKFRRSQEVRRVSLVHQAVSCYLLQPILIYPKIKDDFVCAFHLDGLGVSQVVSNLGCNPLTMVVSPLK